jgi:hypothetical protein
MRQLFLIELNEINFCMLERYAREGVLPNFANFLDTYGYTETYSEKEYEHLEPWIQWVTAHTGLSFAEHGVFRLGDIVHTDHVQIWEKLESRGYKVGAISPMNAKYRMADPAFFVPDPWTSTGIAAPAFIKRLHAAIKQAVNDNAEARITPRSAAAVAEASGRLIGFANASQYVSALQKSFKAPWFRAIYLDLLLSDVFLKSVKNTKLDFCSLFLNAGAHIQHHYMFSSSQYQGTLRNPDWYIDKGQDPVADVYMLYDSLLGRVRSAFPEARIMLATGLHQDPHSELQYYWRLKEHHAFLNRIGIECVSVEARMSRDFIVNFDGKASTSKAAVQLAHVFHDDGKPLFAIDNRGESIFVELTYPNDITPTAGFMVGNTRHEALRDAVSFVAIKNGHHNGIGYFSDSGTRLGVEDSFELTDLPRRIEEAMADLKPPRAAIR